VETAPSTQRCPDYFRARDWRLLAGKRPTNSDGSSFPAAKRDSKSRKLPYFFENPETQASMPLRLVLIHPPPQPGFPAPDASDKKFNSRLVAPTPFDKK
jgi:hypothetical protein